MIKEYLNDFMDIIMKLIMHNPSELIHHKMPCEMNDTRIEVCYRGRGNAFDQIHGTNDLQFCLNIKMHESKCTDEEWRKWMNEEDEAGVRPCTCTYDPCYSR